MNGKKLLKIKDADMLRVELEVFLYDHAYDLPLEDLCHRSGTFELDQVSIDEVEHHGDSITASIAVDFTELLSTSCAECTLTYDKGCTMTVLIAEDGSIEFSDIDEHWDGEEYGEQEFDDDDEVGDNGYDPSQETEF